MKAPVIDVADGLHRLTMTVKVVASPRLRVRMWLGLKIVELGARVMGIGHFKVEL